MQSVRPNSDRVNSLKKILQLSSTNGDGWCIYAYVINNDIIGADGKVDDLRGAIIPLGSYADKSSAERRAKDIIAATGYPGVVVAKYASFIPLTTTPSAETITTVNVDVQGKVMKLEKERTSRENAAYERQLKYQEELEKESQNESDPTHIEYFKRNCYLAVKNWFKYKEALKETEQSLKEYEGRRLKIKEHYSKYPDHEAQWLPYFKEKLQERGEIELYAPIAAGYQELREKLLQ